MLHTFGTYGVGTVAEACSFRLGPRARLPASHVPGNPFSRRIRYDDDWLSTLLDEVLQVKA